MKRLLIIIGLMVWVITAQGATQHYPWYLPGFGGELDSVRFIVFQDTTLDNTITADAAGSEQADFPTTIFIPYDDTSRVTINAFSYFNADSTAYKASITLANTVTRLEDSHGTGTWGSGTGSNDFTVRVVDTLNNDTLMGVAVTLWQMGGAIEAVAGTNSSGMAGFRVPLDSFRVVAHRTGYVWATDSFLVAGNDTVTIEGYDDVGNIAADTAGRCMVTGLVTDAGENPVRYAKVIFTLPSQVIFNDCDSALIGTNTVSGKTNANGAFAVPLTPSTCLQDKDWLLRVVYTFGGVDYTIVDKKPITVPDLTTYQVIFE